ncbi:tetratricopeptide repeat protein [Gammaproteobacteria bacterium]|nr:tetratricopeptide repeat protein [Gammaproteobacteria bacterium]
MMKYITTLIICCWLAKAALASDTLSSALIALDERDYERAIGTLIRLSEKQHDRDVLFHLARVQYHSGAFDDASDTLEDFHQQYPNDGEAYYLSGLVYLALVSEVNVFKKVGMANNALSSWEASVAADPGNLNSRYAIFAYYTNAPRIAGGDMDIAREHMNEIEQLDEGYGAMARGLLLSKEKDLAGAEAALQQAAILMNRAGPYFSLAQFYMQNEQYEKAISSVQQFQNREKRWWDPDATVAYLVMASANAELGNFEIAKKLAELGLSMNPNKQVKKGLNALLKNLKLD